MIAGTLELQMTADLVKLITGSQQASRAVTSSMKEIENSARSVKTILEGLGVGLSVGALVAFAKSTVDAIAKMKDLGEQAGITAQAMSKFEAPTRIAGSSLDLVATAMDKMSKSAVAGLNPLSAQGQAFAAIGISTKQLRTLAPDQLFELIARQLDKFSDGISKNAVMQAIFSRGGAEMNSTMKAIAATTELHATVTQKDADEAKHLEEEIAKLKIASDAYWRSLASDAVPWLTKLVDKLTEITKGMGFWKMELLGFAAIFGIDLTKQLGTASDKVLALKNQIIDLQNAVKQAQAVGGANTPAIVKRYTDQIASLQQQIAALQPAASAVGLSSGDESAGLNMNKPKISFDPNAAKSLALFQQENQALDQQIAKLKGVGELEAFIEKLQENKYATLSPKQKEELTNKEKQLIQLQDEKKARELLGQSIVAYYNELQKVRDAEAAAANAHTQKLADMQFEISLLGKTADEQEKLTALRQADLDLMNAAAQMSSADQDGISDDEAKILSDLVAQNEQFKAQLPLILGIKKATNDQLTIWGDLSDRAAKFFSDLVLHGRQAFDNLKTTAKQFFAEMVALFAKRLVLQLAASATGSAALGNAAASTGQGTLSGAGGNLLSSTATSIGGNLIAGGLSGGSGVLGGVGSTVLGSGLSTTLFGSAGLTDSLAFTGTGLSGLVGSGAVALGASAETAAAIASWVPVIGWIIAIAAILYAIFSKAGGGPKMQGAMTGLFSSTGNFLTSVPGAEDITNIHGTQDANNAQAQTIGAAAARGIVQSITALGGSPSAFQLGLGFSMDPSGTAPSFFHGVLRDAKGNETFRYQNDNLSRDPKEFQTEVQAALSRMTVGALQNDHSLAEAIQRWVHTIDATTATDADIDRILKGAAALKSLIDDTASLTDTIKELNDPTGITALLDGLKGLDKSVTDAKKALDEAQASGDPQQFLAAEQAYKQAVMSRYQQEIAMVRQLQDAIRQTQEAAYQFALAIAGRINAVGGSQNVAGLAMSRATSLRAGIGTPNPLARNPAEPVAMQIQDLQSYVGAIDTWYQDRRQAILDDAQKQADAINKANQDRVAQLQSELTLVNSMKNIIDQAQAMAKDMQLSSSNPLSALGRLDIAKDDVAALRAQFMGSTGQAQVDAGQALLQALTTERGLAESTLQRPSGAYQDVYNQIQGDLALLGKDAQSIAQQQLDLTQQIAASSGVTADAATIAKSQLDALDSEALGYYTWAQGQGERLYALQQAGFQSQLDAITGGSDPELFIAQKTSEMRDLLEQLVKQNQDFLDGIGKPADTTPGPPGGDPTGGTGGNPLARPHVVVIHTTLSADQVVTTLKQGGAAARRLLATS